MDIFVWLPEYGLIMDGSNPYFEWMEKSRFDQLATAYSFPSPYTILSIFPIQGVPE